MKSAPDHSLLFHASPYPYLVMSNDLTIIDANPAYLRAVGRTKEDIVGRYVFDAFPENPGDPDSTNVREVKASLETAIATRRPHTTPFLRYAVPEQTAEGTVFREMYWSTVHTPALDEAGNVAFVFQNAIDVTDLYRFDKKSQSAEVDLEVHPAVHTENFSRAQMHEAMARILKDERGHLRNLFNQAPGFVAVLTGPDHVFEMVNEAYYQLVGHRDIIGKPVWEALPEVQGQGYEEILDRVFNTGEPWKAYGMPLEVQRRKDGPVVKCYIDLSYQAYRAEDGSVLGIFAQGYDVTEAVEAQAARRESEERLQAGMQAARMVVWDWEIESRRMVFSDNVRDVLGRSADNIDSLYDSIHPQDQEKMRIAHERAFIEKSGYDEIIRFIRPDNGRTMWVNVCGRIRCDADGKPFAVRGMTLDVTERMQAEEELREAHRRKDEFLAMLAHELRNPLAPISSAAELMKMVKLDEDRLRQTADIITRQIAHMTGLVDDLIDVSRVTRGLITIDSLPLDVKRIVSDAIEQTLPIIESRRHQLSVDLAGEPVHVLGDPKRLVQVLTNILNNAAKYTPEGGNIRLQMQLEPHWVHLHVTDDGAGISADLLPQVFELFTQAERTSDRSQGGLGIGLALVRSLVDLHGGKVTVFSEGLGKGSRFSVSLPRLVDQAHQADNGRPGAWKPVSENSLRVMIVDDNEDAAQMLAMILEAAGHQVSVEYNARAALEKAGFNAPDVFLLDIGLPEMDGNELARRLRAEPQTSRAVLVAITGYGQDQDRKRTAEAGFDHHLVKPIDHVALAGILGGVGRG
jgi:PAS domain S-box-containing protein